MKNPIRHWVIRYKMRRVHDVVQQAAVCMNDQGQLAVPLITNLYAGIATHVINKTYDDPAPLSNLIDALQECALHYGPGVFEVLSAYKTEMSAVADYIQPQLVAFRNAVQAVADDANPT